MCRARPRRRATRSASTSVTSTARAVARPPAASTSATVSAAAAASMSVTQTWAPSSAKRSAPARPMPEPAAVITATLPCEPTCHRPTPLVWRLITFDPNMIVMRRPAAGAVQADAARIAASCSAKKAISSGVPGRDPERVRGAEPAERPHDRRRGAGARRRAPRRRRRRRRRGSCRAAGPTGSNPCPRSAVSRSPIASRLTAPAACELGRVVEARERRLLRERRDVESAPHLADRLDHVGRADRRSRRASRRARRSSRTCAARRPGDRRWAYSATASG